MMRVLRIIGVTMFILSLWHLLVVLTGLPAFILPSPARVGMALVGNLELIAHHASVTMAEVMIGLASWCGSWGDDGDQSGAVADRPRCCAADDGS
jgi:putative hydroxymethylpyrimidine transport system permease protein